MKTTDTMKVTYNRIYIPELFIILQKDDMLLRLLKITCGEIIKVFISGTHIVCIVYLIIPSYPGEQNGYTFCMMQSEVLGFQI